jgi:hypothetical protein
MKGIFLYNEVGQHYYELTNERVSRTTQEITGKLTPQSLPQNE